MPESLVLEYVLDGAVILLVGAVGWLIKTVVTTSRRVGVLEATEDSAGIRQELGDVHARVNGMAKTVDNTDGRVTEIARSVRIIQQHLMGSGGDQ